jgi:hypothetical protein
MQALSSSRASGIAFGLQQRTATPAAGAAARRRPMTTKLRASAADRVQLGDSDLKVSTCCLGTMTYGMQNTEAEAHEQLSYAFGAAGLNFLDVRACALACLFVC